MSSFGDFALLRNSALLDGDKLCRRDKCEPHSPFQTATCNQANNDENNDPNARCASLRKTGGEKSAYSPEERVTKFNDIWDPAFGLQNSLPSRDRGVSSPLAPRHLSNFKTPTKNTKAKTLTSTASKVKSIKRSVFQSAITTEEKGQRRNLNMNGERDELFDLTQNLALLVEEEFGEVEECQTVERKTPNSTNIINYDKSNPCYMSLRKARGDESEAIIEELSSENESLKKKVDLLLSERYERYSLKSAFGDLQSSLDSKTKEARKLEEKLHRTEARLTDLQETIKRIQMELDLERKERQKSLDPIDNMMIQGKNLSPGANVHERSRTTVEDEEKRQTENAKEPTSAFDTSTSEIHRGLVMADPFERGSVTTLEDDKNNVFMQVADTGVSKRDLEAELIEMKELVQTLNCEKADFSQNINNITATNSTLLEKLESIKAENNQLLLWSDNVVKDNDSLMKKMSDAKFELESKKVKLSNLEVENNAMVHQLKTIEDQVTAVIEQHIEQENLLKADLEKLNEAIQSLLYEKSEAIRNLISVTARNSLLVKELEEATRNLSKVKSEKASLEAEKQEHMQTLQSGLEAAHIKLTQLETETSSEREDATHNLPDVQSQKNADEAELQERVETLEKELNLVQTKNTQFESDFPTEQEKTARYLQNADIQNDWNSTRAPQRDSLDTEATIPLPDDVQAIYDNANAQQIVNGESYCDDSDHFSISSFDIGFDHHGSSSNYNHECSDDGSLGQTGNEESEGVEHYQQLLHQMRKIRVNHDGIVLHGNNVAESVHTEVPCSTLAVSNEVIATVNKKHNYLQESSLQNAHPKGRRTRASFTTNPTAPASAQSKDACIEPTKDSLIELSDQVRVLLDTKDMFGDFREEW